ncbi:TauD/TfdA family dioxygenase [Roseomonas sp. NAR14]|uniref:TauD/TfdA family dioxygenase n=1 Tax=Roseomonas acroporae TaxID=2937791 RepID=A0A9X2BV64_9PROT|nr:TauD/TfdA family dioxygenase [Roseomonas acroporae]MCK8783689.1 TauD/TfdA family dioxygenase [Roseomonas acroporae]
MNETPEFRPVADASVWRGADLVGDPAWIHWLGADEVEELAAALAVARAKGERDGEKGRGLATTAITRDDFPLPTLGPRLAALREEARLGRGFFLIRGLPADRFDEAEREAIFWGIGTWLGSPVSQNAHGELLGHVFDQGRTYGAANTRGYQTNARLPYHTDRCDLVGLLCQRKAKAGGLSSIVSTMAVHDEILRTRPDLLPYLYRGYRYGEREAADRPDGVTPHRIPVFSRQDGLLSCRFIRSPIDMAVRRTGIPHEPAEAEALELMTRLTEDPELRLDMDLEPGDMQFCNNYVTAHSRTGFEDFAEPARRRLMVRLWLSFPERRKLAPDFGEHDGIPQRLAAEAAPPVPA